VKPCSRPVLALDASGLRTSAALLAPGAALREREAPAGERAGTALHELLRVLLEEAGLTPADLALVGAVRGPGSFTGLRVGLAAAQGLCLAAGLPGVGVDTTAALAWATGRQGLIRVLLDGGQGRLFSGRHLRAGERFEALGPVEDLTPEEALARVRAEPGEACFIRGEPACLEQLDEAGVLRWSGPLAGAAAELAARGLATAGLEPSYAREPAIRPRQP